MTRRHRWSAAVWSGCLAAGLPGALTGLYVAGFCGWLLGGWGGPQDAAAISDAAFLPLSLTAALLCWRAARRLCLAPQRARAWRLISISYLCYWAGDLGWFYFDAIRGVRPYPSLADVGYLCFYPFLAAGLLRLPAARRTLRERVVLGLDTATVSIGSLLVIWYLVIGPTIRADSALSSAWLSRTLDVAYPLGDALVLFALAVVLLRTSDKRDPPLVVLSAGLAIFVVADVVYSRMSLDGTYHDGSWVNALWMVGQGLTIVSAHLAGRRTDRPELRNEGVAAVGAEVSRLPFVAIAGAFTLLIVVTAQQSSGRLIELVAGVVVLTTVVALRHLTALQENKTLVARLKRAAQTDHLTGIANRAQFFASAEASFALSSVDKRCLGLMMIDVDHFKVINDTHGHAVGDTVLRQVAAQIRGELRRGDLLARYGGDELVVLLPSCSEDSLCEIAERIVRTVRDSPADRASPQVAVTVSIGAARSEGAASLLEALARADYALYATKRAGRDNWSVHGHPERISNAQRGERIRLGAPVDD